VGKRLVKSPKVYVRDSGLVHALLGLGDTEALLGHPIAGASWEGWVIESLLACAPDGSEATFYRTSAGAEIDLLITLPGSRGRPWAIEIKRSLTPTLERGFHFACEDVRPARKVVVYPGAARFPLGKDIEALGVIDFAAQLLTLGGRPGT
jgi:predicted AAA+ superfamily ATPase